MSAVTWMGLPSRPGALARAQTGLARLPRPVKAAKRKGQRVASYAPSPGTCRCSTSWPGLVEDRTSWGRKYRVSEQLVRSPNG